MRHLRGFKTIIVFFHSCASPFSFHYIRTQDLFKWLSTKQQEGYTIVGLEQTSSSKSIDKYEFPKKTVLLLGKEKEGIPVEFLQLVDQCIEIPQHGIIRSLNVHVSAAICIWEYSKQHQHLALKE
mmetsp:Transcript_9779/g.14353  ORF Transcript_9779/g.14353 Transcript_9779/m.14353 type:complete len:125 (-) Transcript_9779:1849-2223(-)